MKTFLVQMADRAWTEAALHVACAMAHSSNGSEGTVVLLRMIQMQHYSWLGTDFGWESFSPEESSAIWSYKAIAEKYGVELCVEPMQWLDYVDALVQAADDLDADAVFAHVPASKLPLWRRCQTWDLRRQLQHRQRALYTLDQPAQPIAIPAEVERLAHQS
jgi:hypothetical protein